MIRRVKLSGREPPKAFLIWSLGVIYTTKGDFLFDQEALDSVMAAWKDYGNRLAIDYNHAMVSGSPRQGVAAGSFTLESRPDGLWATDVRWTDTAARELSAGEWLHFSPCFESDTESGRIVNLINIALTNTPATKHAKQLVAASRKTKMTEEELIAAYKAALQALVDAGIEVPRDTEPPPAPTSATDATALATLSLVKALADKVDRMEAAKPASPVNELLVKVKAAGLEPNTVKAITSLARVDIESAKHMFRLAPRSPSVGKATSAPVTGAPVSSLERRIALSLGVSAEKFAATKEVRRERLAAIIDSNEEDQ